MAVFRIEKTRDYTVMSNHHLRDKSLSLKAKGLLSLMLSLPEEWDYGNEYLYVDEDMRLRLETKLIHSIVTGFKVLPV